MADAERTVMPITVPDGAITIHEFAAMLGVRRQSAALHMRRLLDQGRATRVVRTMERIDGQVIPIPAYVLKPK